MKRATVGLIVALAAGSALAASKAYQVTGPVVDVSENAIVIEKGKEKWEIARDASTKIDGDLKKGARATVHYRMTATEVEVKSTGKGAGKSAPGKPAAGGEAKGEGAPAR